MGEAATRRLYFRKGPNGGGTLEFEVAGKVVKRVPAVGGIPKGIIDKALKDKKITRDQVKGYSETPDGQFIIGPTEHHKSPGRWVWSKIEWNAKLREDPKTLAVEFFNGSRWVNVKQFTGITRELIVSKHEELYGVRTVPDKWIFNDFGEWAIKFYADKNRNEKLDPAEKKAGVRPEFIHTSPETEAQTEKNKKLAPADQKPIELSYSHGCIHVKPEDRDTLKLLGAFDSGTPLIITTAASK